MELLQIPDIDLHKFWESNKLIIPVVAAAIGYLVKIIIELVLEFRRKSISQLEERLKLFYWPLLIRIKKDNAIWEMILSIREDASSMKYKIAERVEAEVLRNHQEALEIIEENIHLADPDPELVVAISQYIKNVTVYKAIRDAGDATAFPLQYNAPWPDQLYRLLDQKTQLNQNRLNSFIGVKSPAHLFKNYNKKTYRKKPATVSAGLRAENADIDR
ncbi:hypothetical protein ACFSJU_13835 [Paradesertivirga mongoliensis]|uniref:LemA family protein n=1 Tax=Paradesertivirga mongoliensis TaxID=2100740 RepID=A0ABW4ZNL7_9SPHI|nr:hypothetical protein [Pedobacter mongoliensis]